MAPAPDPCRDYWGYEGGVSPLITVFYPSFINGVNTLKKI